MIPWPLQHSGRSLSTASTQAYWSCVRPRKRLHFFQFSHLYSALEHHRPYSNDPQASCQSAFDDLPEQGYGRPKTFKSLQGGPAARFNALYQKRPRFSLRASARETLPAGASDTTLFILASYPRNGRIGRNSLNRRGAFSKGSENSDQNRQMCHRARARSPFSRLATVSVIGEHPLATKLLSRKQRLDPLCLRREPIHCRRARP